MLHTSIDPSEVMTYAAGADPGEPICPVEGQGPNYPHFWGSATPHGKSWIRPCAGLYEIGEKAF